MSPDPNSIPFEPDKEKIREEKFTMVELSEYNWILTDCKLTQVKQRRPVEDFNQKYTNGC